MTRQQFFLSILSALGLSKLGIDPARDGVVLYSMAHPWKANYTMHPIEYGFSVPHLKEEGEPYHELDWELSEDSLEYHELELP